MINRGEDLYGEEFGEACGDTLSTEMVSRYASVARRVPAQNRRPALSWSAHAAVARLPHAQQRRLLAEAGKARLEQRRAAQKSAGDCQKTMMTYTPTEIALIAIIMSLGSVVQGAVGFASGLLGVPLLVLTGFSLPEAATINLVSTSVQNITGAWKLWPHLDPSELAFPVLVRWLAIPCGTYLAYIADQRTRPGPVKTADRPLSFDDCRPLVGLQIFAA